MATRHPKFSLSHNAQSLEISARTRCLLKIDAMKEEPYLLKTSDLDEYLNDLPSTYYTDIVNYLVYSTSYLMVKPIKAKKLFQAGNNVLSGWVMETAMKHYEENRPTKTGEPLNIENDQMQREFLRKLSLCGTSSK